MSLLKVVIGSVVLGLCLTACSHTQAKPDSPATASAKSVSQSKTSPATAQMDSQQPAAAAKTAEGFRRYSAALRQDAEQRGYPKALLDEVFASLKFHQTVVKSDKGQPEFVETLDTYLPKRVNQVRINMARALISNIRRSCSGSVPNTASQPDLLSPCGGWRVRLVALPAIIRCPRHWLRWLMKDGGKSCFAVSFSWRWIFYAMAIFHWIK